jgi:polysaccharide biosynthesis transport protein
MAPLDPISDHGDSQHEVYEANGSGVHSNGAPATNGTLAKIGSQLPSVAPLNWSYGPPPRPEILSARPNPLELLYAVRRRWPLAVGLGALLSSIVACALWFVIPVKYEAFALLRVSSREPVVLEKGATAGTDFDLFKATQSQLILSNFVMNKVLHDPSINQLASVREQADDPVSWLKGQLMVDYPGNAEVMRIGIRTKSKADSLRLVDKVVEVYLKEIVDHEKTLRMANEAKIQRAFELKSTEYQRGLDNLLTLERKFETTGSNAAQIKKKMAMEALNNAIADRSMVVNLLNQNEMATMLTETRMQKPVMAPEVIIDMQLEGDREIAQMRAQLRSYQDYLVQLRETTTNSDATPYVAKIHKEVLRLEEAINEIKHERRPRLLELFAAGAGQGDRGAMTPEELKAQREYLQQRLEETTKKVEEKTAEVSGLESFHAAVTAKQEELAGARELKNQLSAEVERIRIEQLAPERILQLEKAVPDGGGDAIKKYIAMVFAMVFTFAGVLLVVAVLEFQSRKVNSVKEVNDGLGIRVVGELPNIGGRAFRRVRGGKGQNVLKALMAERIDGTRTALIHTTAIDPPRVVMVTSAEPHEGKTTTSTQLAASLARSGRRTLLIDADVRNPGAHRVFEMPQDPGLCELLRHEADRDAVIHPTRTANLWLMPAGRCDLRSVQALSGSYLGSTIAALSVQFDYVIIDAGPVLKVADPLLVGQHVDAAVVSVLKDVSKVPNVYEAVERLRSVGITVLGSVVNGVKDDVARHGMELLMAESPRHEPAASTSAG